MLTFVSCEACRESVESSSGLVIDDFSPRNFERLESFQEIARKTDRELVAEMVGKEDIALYQDIYTF